MLCDQRSICHRFSNARLNTKDTVKPCLPLPWSWPRCPFNSFSLSHRLKDFPLALPSQR